MSKYIFTDISEKTVSGENFHFLSSLGLIHDPEFHNRLLAYLLTVTGDHGYGSVFLKKLFKRLGLDHLNLSRVWTETNIVIPPTKMEAAAGEKPVKSTNILIEVKHYAVIIINGFMNDEIFEGESYRILLLITDMAISNAQSELLIVALNRYTDLLQPLD